MDRLNSEARPMRRDQGLIVREVEGEVVVYDLDRHRAHCLNPEAARLWRACDGARTLPELLSHLHGDLAGPEHQAALRLGLEDLAKNRLLEGPEAESMGAFGPRTSRRELMARLGRAAALTVALPTILSIVSPTPAEAASCLASGSACSSSSQCCSGLCLRYKCA